MELIVIYPCRQKLIQISTIVDQGLVTRYVGQKLIQISTIVDHDHGHALPGRQKLIQISTIVDAFYEYLHA